MSIFKRSNPVQNSASQAGWAEMVLANTNDGVIITNKSGVIEYINPAAVRMTECGSADKAIGLDYGLLIKIESKEGRELPDKENRLIQAMNTGQSLDGYQVCIIAGQSGKRIPVAIAVLLAGGSEQARIITMRDITKELIEEGEQTEFISTASHEMRTPVATIDGYLALALNPQTATIDNRARNYLAAAHAASQHLGKLFHDLLDITKLDDGKIRPHFEPVDMTKLVYSIFGDYDARAREAKLNFTFGTDGSAKSGSMHRVDQVVYGYVDTNFMREILDNLIENAFKYTPAGGSIYVNVRGDGDRALINVTDTGIGISAEDLGHIFQKFYRADNSDTRTIGGSGLGLYLVKQRAEAMGGKVWAESSFGEGSTFYVSLPRISEDEYNKRMIAVRGQQMQRAQAAQYRQAQLQQFAQAKLRQLQQASALAPQRPPVASTPQPPMQQATQPRAPAAMYTYPTLPNNNNPKGVQQ